MPLDQFTAVTTANTATQRILDAVKVVLSDGQPRFTRDLVAELERAGVQIGGTDKAQNLSTALSRAKDTFTNDRKAGWSLKPSVAVAQIVESETAPENFSGAAH